MTHGSDSIGLIYSRVSQSKIPVSTADQIRASDLVEKELLRLSKELFRLKVARLSDPTRTSSRIAQGVSSRSCWSD